MINKRKLLLLFIDFLIITSCCIWCSAVFLYIGKANLSMYQILLTTATVVSVILIVRLFAGMYTSIWRYGSTRLFFAILISDSISYLVIFPLCEYVFKIDVPFSYITITVMAVMLLTLTSRFIYQILYAKQNILSERKNGNAENNKINVVIVGAGNVGATLADELERNPNSHYRPYCFVDTDKQKVGNTICGLKIYADNDKTLELIRTMPVQEIVIAVPDASNDQKNELYNRYLKTGCKIKIYDYPLSEGSPEGKRVIREFNIEDLLFRDSISINDEDTFNFYTGKTILVTGGGGSIGSELCRQIAKFSPKQLIILDIYENNAYEIQQELIRKYENDLNLSVVIASVRDPKRLDEIFNEYRPEIVFHAAAHKHVPLMENNACEAIKNNVIGTYNTANAAEKYRVKKFVLISTDKAVNPTNIMGASKRLCEMVIQSRNDSNTEFCAVRFGNVLGSNGSVIPLFNKQIRQGGPITLTDKRIIRYFMTIPEAVQLVMEAGAMAHNGELFVLDMGKPVKILDLAENMIRLSGFVPYKDIDIVEIGLRPGEKLYEELLMKNEQLSKTKNDLIFIEKDKPIKRDEMEEKLAILRTAVEQEGYEHILNAIKATVPTYHSPDEVNKCAEASSEMKMTTCDQVPVC